jgi:hypothetical protein
VNFLVIDLMWNARYFKMFYPDIVLIKTDTKHKKKNTEKKESICVNEVFLSFLPQKKKIKKKYVPGFC